MTRNVMSLGIRFVGASLMIFSRCRSDFDLPGRQTHDRVKHPLLVADNLTTALVFDERETH
jgi:hypothetical protein